jgi:dolichol-phosphate mannosyltransferase
MVPCHNEEMNVGPLVRRLIGLFDRYIHEIILLNDNSNDKTGDVIDELAHQDPRIKSVHRAPPNGVGRTITDGLRLATGNYVLC